VFGRHKNLLTELAAVGDRFVFAQGYSNIADVEAPLLRGRAHTITLPLPAAVFRHQNTWSGEGREAIFVCPSINVGPYYREIYDGIKSNFGDLPHRIFGRQEGVVDDPAVLPYLADRDLFALYARAPVFVYPHNEPRHVHYSPLEAMVVGTPTLYLKGSLIDALVDGADLPGACQDIREMRRKAELLMARDPGIARAIQATQSRVLETFAPDLARRQWQQALPELSNASIVA
ncbi:MAG: hypothetical protein JO326_10755, partial [Acetobacteraceae bacterium]|nr:hypothetical protein [Acetobacteraceae bacterium]